MSVRTLSVALIVALGCGGRSTPPYVPWDTTQRPSGPVDIPAMRALVDRYSPTGSWVVNAADTLPGEFEIGGRKVTLSSDATFGKFYDDGSPVKLVTYTSTAIHEVYHSITSRLGYRLLVDAKATDLVDNEGVYVGGTPLLVVYSAHYPAREMDATFPADARTSRYKTYISPSGDINSTQTSGVFGLLDEWAAYFHSGRTLVDFWPWIRDEAPRTQDVYIQYRWQFHSLAVSYAEFKLFILHYLVHARAHRPDVYRALLANASFKRAFKAIDDAWRELVSAAAAIQPHIEALARERGATNMTYEHDDAYPAVLRRLASPQYQQMLAELLR